MPVAAEADATVAVTGSVPIEPVYFKHRFGPGCRTSFTPWPFDHEIDGPTLFGPTPLLRQNLQCQLCVRGNADTRPTAAALFCRAAAGMAGGLPRHSPLSPADLTSSPHFLVSARTNSATFCGLSVPAGS